MTNTLGIMLEILNNYPWTRLTVRIIGAIKRQFSHMATHLFDNSNLSQEIFAINTWRTVMCSLRHGRKHMLSILPTLWRPVLNLYHSFARINGRHLLLNRCRKKFCRLAVTDVLRLHYSRKCLTSQESEIFFKVCLSSSLALYLCNLSLHLVHSEFSYLAS